MSALTRPVTAIFGVLGVLLAGLFFATSSANAYPGSSGGTVSVGTSTPAEGGTLSVSAAGFQPGETVSISLHTAVYSLGTATADSSGAFSTSVTLPAGVTGSHTVVLTGLTSGTVASFAIDIAGTSTSTGSSSGSGGLSNTGVAVIGIGALGVVLLAGGGLLLMAGKRRKVSI